jgi:hypothetical protein
MCELEILEGNSRIVGDVRPRVALSLVRSQMGKERIVNVSHVDRVVCSAFSCLVIFS